MGFVYVNAGKTHSVLIDGSGYVYMSGDNSYRQLGFAHQDKLTEFKKLTDFPYKAKQVAAGP